MLVLGSVGVVVLWTWILLFWVMVFGGMQGFCLTWMFVLFDVLRIRGTHGMKITIKLTTIWENLVSVHFFHSHLKW